MLKNRKKKISLRSVACENGCVPLYCLTGWYLCRMKDVKTIKRVDAVRQMEIREDQYGNKILFSIQFYNKQGEVVTMSHAFSCGLRVSLKENRLRGMQQCDAAGNKIGHPVPVSIDNIRMFNGMKVVL